MQSGVLPLLAISLLFAQAAPVATPAALDLGVLDQYVKNLQYVELEKAIGPLPASPENPGHPESAPIRTLASGRAALILS